MLDIVIHSLYTDKEIFVRELISNASDALEKLRFHQTAGSPVHQPDAVLGITVVADEAANTITFTDTGIGMTRGELVENLGTIAHSGSKAFVKRLAEEKKEAGQLIGQFGVGFYSAFMVASKVEVFTRSYQPEETGCRWVSEGAGGYEIEPAADLPRGTKIVVYLKETEKDFAKNYRLEQIINRYSSFVPFNIDLNGKTLNTVRAIWARNKSEVKDEEYNEFYKFIGHDSEAPLTRLHFTADAPLAIQALLFVPTRNWETSGMARMESEVHLYCKKVLIQSKTKGLLPEWLRFLKGVVDSEDLPLNISRETMQDSSLMQKLNKVLTSKFLKHLEELATKDPDAFKKFHDEFGRFLKEAVVTDFTHREAAAKLLRYESSTLAKGEKTSLADYVTRMGTEQKEIYYLIAANRDAAEASPYFEVFQSRKLEVIFMYDPWDEFVMEHLSEFEGKKTRSAEKADLKLEDAAPPEGALSDADAEALAKWLKETLGERVGAVRASKRLVGSPAAVVDSDDHMTSTMRKMLKHMERERGTASAAFKSDLEINPRHPIIARLDKTRQADATLAGKVAEQILDNALVAAGLLEDPRNMLKRLNELLEQVLVTK